MRVRIINDDHAYANGKPVKNGQIVEVSEADGQSMINVGMAEAVE